ncbi:MAG: 1,4-dihydroxy-2-naphthoate polyprenyltransferase [Actinobacteria bacterium]|nr:MAG: 1,4-dihydroxy-2-naphthoate polyprenyltransferase [Actinomycetota bacterium]
MPEPSRTAVATGSAAAWLLAVRPKTLPAAASGVVVATVLAWRDGAFALGPALAALAIAVLLQVASNLANDVYDDERGADTPDRLGPTRVTNAGLLSRTQVKTGLKIALAVAFALGVYLTFVRGWFVLVIGLAAMVSAVAYTGGPYPLGYHGLGEVFVFTFFGVACVAGTYWVQSGSVTPAVWLMTVPPGLIITAILVVNNLRDVEQDRRVGKRTLAVRLGVGATRAEWVACVAGAYVVVTAGVAAGLLPPHALAAWLSVPLALVTGRTVLREAGRPLNAALARTGMLALVFALLFAAGVVAAGR